MDDIPLGTMTGTWDTAQGIPDKKTGIPDMTLRYVRFVCLYFGFIVCFPILVSTFEHHDQAF
jgi:hypothetical protein